ncbi:division/cell wall cluster transcriptional repressor MraZ [Insolitispirillum peregrinum]|uniref:division/cell wall cluster transcriptional repressor MraZ n=1 Tax=Insolitispirillum peregrinum TaxID=80876 RepID=UPI0036D3D4AB
MPLFLGNHNNKVDRKGRVSVPASFRKHLSSDDGCGFVAIPSFPDPDQPDDPPCLEGMGYGQLHAMQEAVAASYGIYSEEYQSFTELTFGMANELACDADGRVVLPQALLDHADISDSAVFWGLGSKFLILSPRNHQKKLAATLRRTGGRKPNVLVRPTLSKTGDQP